MLAVKAGDTVKVHYTATFPDGAMCDTSDGDEPLAFTVGAGQVIPGFDQALVGMHVDDVKDIVVQPGEAYGEREEGLVQTIRRDQFRLGEIEPQVGMAIEMRTP